ncbi:MAG: helix-turn-helix transcriptional regulator [Acidobacteria bacterium]|nr:helix-turn-helix transcriptional regulator [Acidobacteriota bacterium]
MAETSPVEAPGVAVALARNVRQLREARGMTQAQVSKLAGLPRATWAHLESGGANPTLNVLLGAATALQVTVEELLAEPRAAAKHYAKGALPEKVRPGGGLVRKLLPDPIPGMDFDRMELPPQTTITGIPHTAGTREYLACESGALRLTVSGESFTLTPGDVVAFRGDQKHAYQNVGSRTAVGYSVVVLARVR